MLIIPPKSTPTFSKLQQELTLEAIKSSKIYMRVFAEILQHITHFRISIFIRIHLSEIQNFSLIKFNTSLGSECKMEIWKHVIVAAVIGWILRIIHECLWLKVYDRLWINCLMNRNILPESKKWFSKRRLLDLDKGL